MLKPVAGPAPVSAASLGAGAGNAGVADEGQAVVQAAGVPNATPVIAPAFPAFPALPAKLCADG